MYMLTLLVAMISPPNTEYKIEIDLIPDFSIRADLRYHEYLMVKEALRGTSNKLRRALQVNRRIAGVVSLDEIDDLKFREIALKSMVLQRRQLWLESTGESPPIQGIFIKAPIDALTYLKFKKTFPDQAYIVTDSNGKQTYLVTYELWRFYLKGKLDKIPD